MKRIITTPHMVEENVRRFVEDRLYRAREVLVSADLVVMGDPNIFPLDYVEMRVVRTDGKLHYTSGLYQIVQVDHTISSGTFDTKVSLARDGFHESQDPNIKPIGD